MNWTRYLGEPVILSLPSHFEGVVYAELLQAAISRQLLLYKDPPETASLPDPILV
jgi:hypothetical protein